MNIVYDVGRMGGGYKMTGKMLLRKRDLVDATGMPRGTVSDWLTDFAMFMPTIKQGSVTYYKPETLDVLKAIKEIKEQGYLFKMDIVPVLMERGFAVTVEESAQELQKAFSEADTKDVTTKVIAELARQAGQIDEMTERTDELDGRVTELGRITADRLDGHDGQMTEVMRMMQEMQIQLAEAKSEAAAANERAERAEAEAKKPFWKKIF